MKGVSYKLSVEKHQGICTMETKTWWGVGVSSHWPGKYFLHYYVDKSSGSMTVKHTHSVSHSLTHPCNFVKPVLG